MGTASASAPAIWPWVSPKRGGEGGGEGREVLGGIPDGMAWRRRGGEGGRRSKATAAPRRGLLPHPAQALEYQMQQGVTESQKVDAFIRPYSESVHAYGPVTANGVASIQLLV